MIGKEAKEVLYSIIDGQVTFTDEATGVYLSLSDSAKAELRYYIGLIPDEAEKTGLELAQSAIRWAKKDYRGFKQIRRLVVLEAEDPTREIWKEDEAGTMHLVGYKPLMRGELYAIARRRGWKIEGGEFDRCNDHWSTLQRVIMMQRPITCRILNTAKAKVDSVDIRREWLEAFPTEFFPVSSVQEARENCDMGDITALPRRKK